MVVTPSERTYITVWFECFRNGDFDVRDKEHPRQPKKFEDFQLQELFDTNPDQTLLELSKALNVTPKVVSKRLHCWYASLKLCYRFMLRIIVPWFPGSPCGTNLSSMWCRNVIAIFDTLFEVSILRVNKAYCPTQAKGLWFLL